VLSASERAVTVIGRVPALRVINVLRICLKITFRILLYTVPTSCYLFQATEEILRHNSAN
jgi:hypothetical protein